MNDWQPIETAPKDGSAVIVYDMYQTDYKENANGIYRQTGRDGYGVVVAWFKDDKWVMHSRGGIIVDCSNPTKWMPLPATPKDENGTK